MLTSDLISLPNSGYTKKELQQLFGGQQSWTADEIMALELPNWSLLWFAIRPELLSPEILQDFACDCCDTLRPHATQPELKADEALAAKREWIESTSNTKDKELKAAWKEARHVYRQDGFGWSFYLECCMFASMPGSMESARGASWAAAWGMAASKNNMKKWDEEVEKERTRQVSALTGIIRSAMKVVSK